MPVSQGFRDLGGDVVGPASSTDNAVVRWDGITGKLIKNSTAILTNTGELQVGVGAAAGPSLASTAQPSTGFFFTSAQPSIQASVAGSRRWGFADSAVPAQPYTLWAYHASGNIAQFIVNAGLTLRGQITTGTPAALTFDNGGVSFTGSAVAQQGINVAFTLNQASSSSFSSLHLQTTETAIGTGSQHFIRSRGGAGGTTERFSVTLQGGISTASISPAAMGATENDYAAIGEYGVARLTPAGGGTSLTGIVAPLNSNDGRWLLLINVGADALNVQNNDGGSATPNNRILTISGAATAVAAGASMQLYYDATSARWRQVL